MRFHDAHNHLQDERLGNSAQAWTTARRRGARRMIVNGSCEADWPAVQTLADALPGVQAAFGCHPWHLHERSPAWQRVLEDFLDQTPRAVLGEAGLDRWKPGLAYDGQEDALLWQLQLAAQRNLPITLHCLQAWGRLYDLLRAGPRPDCGFLLHSYGGPREMVEPLARLGAYFSLPGFFAHERKSRQRDAFLAVPPDRFLIETDAPDQPLPDHLIDEPCADPATGRPVNHPANLGAVYRFAAELYGEALPSLADRVEQNFARLFGPGAPVDELDLAEHADHSGSSPSSTFQ